MPEVNEVFSAAESNQKIVDTATSYLIRLATKTVVGRVGVFS
ncbi:MAG TPA: hypothetical protein VMD05_06310 [Candidatus Nanoarchaeia archaeon]|nr:hypothetical protein [Candidatus Nanoarchaeia archaeon]